MAIQPSDRKKAKHQFRTRTVASPRLAKHHLREYQRRAYLEEITRLVRDIFRTIA